MLSLHMSERCQFEELRGEYEVGFLINFFS